MSPSKLGKGLACRVRASLAQKLKTEILAKSAKKTKESATGCDFAEPQTLVDIALALNLTVSGIVAHQSALKDGEWMKIPQFKL